MYYIYFLVNENNSRTYIGFTVDIERRIEERRKGKVKSTKNFGRFKIYIIDKMNSVEKAREKEKFYKSRLGRKKLKNILEN